ncbi:hypothetical protein OMB55_00017660 [gamma proteobacterium HIMB55]|nr:hypothetical protein OMB55_00017660 [gamma proteobacterium HIMB55]
MFFYSLLDEFPRIAMPNRTPALKFAVFTAFMLREMGVRGCIIEPSLMTTTKYGDSGFAVYVLNARVVIVIAIFASCVGDELRPRLFSWHL